MIITAISSSNVLSFIHVFILESSIMLTTLPTNSSRVPLVTCKQIKDIVYERYYPIMTCDGDLTASIYVLFIATTVWGAQPIDSVPLFFN